MIEGLPENASGPRLEMVLRAHEAVIPGFTGSLALLIWEEGWAGKPYQPTISSGLTIDPGIDLSAQTDFTLRRFAEGVFSPAEIEALRGCLGIRGKPVWQKMMQLPPLKWTPSQAGLMISRLFPIYWAQARVFVPGLETAPAPVQTAVASLIWNRGLGVLSLSMRAALLGDWPWLLWQWEQMGSNPARRKREVAYLRKGLGLG